jgi:hypothetical protein
MKTSKIKKVKAWAVLDTKDLGLHYSLSRAEIYPLKKLAKQNSRFYMDKIVPCTITYQLPKKII